MEPGSCRGGGGRFRPFQLFGARTGPLLAVSLVPRTALARDAGEILWLLGIASVQGWVAPYGSDHQTQMIRSPERTAHASATTFGPARLE